MTSSLVGSEMCIRDRGKFDRLPKPEGNGRGGIVGGAAQRDGQGVRAVSYTHLTLPTICSV
eukprot:8921636-Prorocentrum_lima.AAC.1